MRPVVTMLLALALAWAAPAPAPARAADPADQAVAVTRTLLADAHRALVGPDDPVALKRAIEGAFDFDVWERFLIADRAERFSEAERREFRTLLPGFMAHLYTDHFDRGLDQAPSIEGVRKVRSDFLVGARFKRATGRDLPVEWRLRTQGAEARVIDVMVGGTSFLLLKREEFHAIIDRDGAAGILAHMRARSL